MSGLAAHGIRNIQQMLNVGATPTDRVQLAARTGISVGAIEELVRLSDLARIPGVKSIRARLYHDAGITGVAVLRKMEPEGLIVKTVDFIQESGFDGVPPLPAEVRFTIEYARGLPIVVEFPDELADGTNSACVL